MDADCEQSLSPRGATQPLLNADPCTSFAMDSRSSSVKTRLLNPKLLRLRRLAAVTGRLFLVAFIAALILILAACSGRGKCGSGSIFSILNPDQPADPGVPSSDPLLDDASSSQLPLNPGDDFEERYEKVLVTWDDNAACLDGSPPAYYFRPGGGSGIDKWHVHLLGGSWCGSTDGCADRAITKLGSSTPWPDPATMDNPSAEMKPYFQGFLSGNAMDSPLLYNWNTAVVIYCDGGGYTGTRGKFDVKPGRSGFHNLTSLYFSGHYNVRAVVGDLLHPRGLQNAKKILFSGCSAGGQAVSLLCDEFASLMPKRAEVKCLLDSGIFSDGPNIYGKAELYEDIQNVIRTHGSSPSLSPQCLETHGVDDAAKCFFASENLKFVHHPIFVSQSMYDRPSTMIMHQFRKPVVDCLASEFRNCSEGIQTDLKSFSEKVMESVRNAAGENPNVSLFPIEGFRHCPLALATWKEFTHNGDPIVNALSSWLGDS